MRIVGAGVSFPVRATFVFFVLFAVFASPPATRALDVSSQTVEGEAPVEGALPQVDHRVELAIHDQTFATKTEFRFLNGFAKPLELTVSFALGAGEMVDGFAYWNGEERILGEVLEKQAAAEIYQQITQVQRRDPGLLEQVGDRFRFRVFPVAPGENKPVEVSTVGTLEIREGVIEYRIPAENLPEEGVPFSLDADITDDLPILSVETVGFFGSLTRINRHHVRLTARESDGDRKTDWLIRYRLDTDEYALRFITHKESGSEGTFMLLVSPKTGGGREEVLGRDVVFVIDVSGSMHGEPLEQTKAALVHVLRRLGDDDRFNVIAFDDVVTPFFPAMQKATPAAVGEAVRGAQALTDRGGTNIKGALLAALAQFGPERAGRAQAVVFLTDGQGNDPPETVLAEMRRADTHARIFAFGAGNGVNRRFLERLARDYRGIATFIQRAQDIESEIRRIDERISMPLMTDLDVAFDGLDIHEAYPALLPDLYRDGQVVLLGRYAEAGEGTIEVTGTQKNRRRKLTIDVALPEEDPDNAHIEKLWAGRRIDQLTDLVALRGAEAAGVEEITHEITRLGIVYNIVTDYTTFLAVPESMKTAQIKQAIKNGTMGYDKKLIDSLDEIRISQTYIPPGDPVLSVIAPADAKSVTAYFPFGLIKPLRYDAVRDRWTVRFLVPRDVSDGVYTVRVRLVHADGFEEWKNVDYTIDATAPEFDIDAPDSAYPSEYWPVAVDPFEAVGSVEAYVIGSRQRVRLTLDPESGLYVGRVRMPDDMSDGAVTVRIVVRDLARNRFEREIEIQDETRREYEMTESRIDSKGSAKAGSAL